MILKINAKADAMAEMIAIARVPTKRQQPQEIFSSDRARTNHGERHSQVVHVYLRKRPELKEEKHQDDGHDRSSSDTEAPQHQESTPQRQDTEKPRREARHAIP